MENVYTPDGRVQWLRSPGERIPAALLPRAWEAARVALIGPLYHEVDAAVIERFRGLVGVCGQGFLRAADAAGRIRPLPPAAWDAAPILRHARALFVSVEDLGGEEGAVAAWTELVPVLAITAGGAGARVYACGEWRHVPAFPAREVDPTGAGDAFAAAFMVALDEGADPWAAARFAAAAASFVVEAPGAVRPDRATVQARMAAYPELIAR
jgi:1D-myo-inositol 3-kinase